MILVGVSGVRVAEAWWLGVSSSVQMLVVSVAVVVAGLIGVRVGRRVRQIIPTRKPTVTYSGLLAVIGLRLTMNGIAGPGGSWIGEWVRTDGDRARPRLPITGRGC